MSINVINNTKGEIDFLIYKEVKKVSSIVKKEVDRFSLNWKFSLIIVDSDEMKSLNKSYRQKESTTDVLSFIYDSRDRNIFNNYLGEIYIDINVLKKQAKELKHSEKRELFFLLIHGLLHLNNYDHEKSTEDEKEMIAIQKNIFKKVKISI